jgi:predicted PurR-regulated permease PerM
MDALPFFELPSNSWSFGNSFPAQVIIALAVGVINLAMLILIGVPRAIMRGIGRMMARLK